MKFQVKAGAHYEDGVRYTKGAVVESEKDLVSIFGKGKFEFLELSDGEPRRRRRKPIDELLEKKDTTLLKAVHIGGGKYNVINTTTSNPINNKPLTKKEATAMVEEGDVDEVVTI